MSAPTAGKIMDMGSNECKLSMLLNWNTIDTCFLSSTLHVRSPAGFLLACFSSFLLVISLEFLRRLQRTYDRYLISKSQYLPQKWEEADEMGRELLSNKLEVHPVPFSRRAFGCPSLGVVLEQVARGGIHMLQFGVSYVVMLLVMYSNVYIIISILLGALVGFALFTRDMVESRRVGNKDKSDGKSSC